MTNRSELSPRNNQYRYDGPAFLRSLFLPFKLPRVSFRLKNIFIFKITF